MDVIVDALLDLLVEGRKARVVVTLGVLGGHCER
jgi:hypothetical protein